MRDMTRTYLKGARPVAAPRDCWIPACNMCDMTHFQVWCDSFVRVTWLLYMCDMTCRYLRGSGPAAAVLRLLDCILQCLWHDSFSCVTWLIWMCDVTSLYTWRHIKSWMNESCHVWMSHVPSDDTDLIICAHTNLIHRITSWRYVTSHMNEPCHEWMSHVPSDDTDLITFLCDCYDMQQLWHDSVHTCHVTHSHVTRKNENENGYRNSKITT